MKRIAVESIVVKREYIIDIPDGESEESSRQRILKCNDDGVIIIPNSDTFVESLGVEFRDLKPGESEDYVIRRMTETKPLPAKSEKTPKSGVDKPPKAAKIVKQSQSNLIKELL